MKVRAIKIRQPLAEFYLAKFSARDLLRISTSAVARYNPSKGIIEGNQRQLDDNRLSAIAKYIQSEEMCFPNSIILAANVDEQGGVIDVENSRLSDKRWDIKVIDEQNDYYEIDIPDSSAKTALVIDGQHRLRAFTKTDDEAQKIEVACSIFFDLPSPYQAYLFATVNANQRRVDKSLALELFGVNLENEPRSSWSPEKLAVYITRQLNFLDASPMKNHVRLGSLLEENIADKQTWKVSTSSLVEGITKLYSSNPQRDRDELVSSKNTLFGNRNRSVLNKFNDNTILRDYYLDCKDEVIVRYIFHFLSSINKKIWKDCDNNSVLTKTIGVSALMYYLKQILINSKDAVEKAETIDFDVWIEKIKEIDYVNPYYSSASGQGRSRLQRAMLFSAGMIDEVKLSEEDMAILGH